MNPRDTAALALIESPIFEVVGCEPPPPPPTGCGPEPSLLCPGGPPTRYSANLSTLKHLPRWVVCQQGALALWHLTLVGMVLLFFFGDRWGVSRSTALVLAVVTILPASSSFMVLACLLLLRVGLDLRLSAFRN
jgi:hypothetical protein